MVCKNSCILNLQLIFLNHSACTAYEQHVASKLLQLRDRRRELDIAEVSTDTLYKSLCKELQNLGHEVNADND